MECNISEIRDIFKVLFDYSLDFLFVYDLNGKILDGNDVALGNLGYTREETLDLNITDFLAEDEIDHALSAVKKIKSIGKTTKYENFTIKNKEGINIYLEVTGIPLKKNDEIYAILGIGHNISEQKKAEKSLLISEEKYRGLFNTSPDAIIIMDSRGTIIDTNLSTERIFGYNKSDLIGKKFFELSGTYPSEFVPLFKKRLEKVTRGELVKPIQFKVTKKDGSLVWINSRVSLLKLGEGILYQATIHDITEKVKIEQELKESEEKFRNLFESSPNFIGVFNKAYQLIDSNDAIEKLLSVHTKADFLGKTVSEMLSTNQKNKYLIPLFEKYFDDVFSGERVEPFGFLLHRSKGGTLWCRLQCTLVKLEKENLIQIIVENITERRNADIKLNISEKKFRRAFEHENFYKDLIAHDMNNILQSIQTSLDLLDIKGKLSEKDQELKESINIIRDQIIRGSNLVKNVRKFSELEDSEKILKKIDLKEVLDNVIKLIRKSSNHKKINIQIETIDDEIFIEADDFLIDVFENIMFNALKHNDNLMVEISIKISEIQKENKTFLKIEFRDNGRGIPENKKQSIFSRAYKEDRSVSGMGLGLSLVKNILENYKAEIWVENRIPGDHSKGSNFIIIFPIEE